MKVCLDTNAYSSLRRGNERLLALLNECDEILVPAAVFAELECGFLRGGKTSENESLLASFLDEEPVSFQPVTKSIAERWGYVKAAQRICREQNQTSRQNVGERRCYEQTLRADATKKDAPYALQRHPVVHSPIVLLETSANPSAANAPRTSG